MHEMDRLEFFFFRRFIFWPLVYSLWPTTPFEDKSSLFCIGFNVLMYVTLVNKLEIMKYFRPQISIERLN